jgi:hypothetical protein
MTPKCFSNNFNYLDAPISESDAPIASKHDNKLIEITS